MTHNEPWERMKHCISGPKSILVQQILGSREVQKTMDVHIVVPRHKPAIEQIVDVFVKRLEICSVDVVHDKVIVRGQFEVKALYVACRPRQPVHAVEVWPVRFTAYAGIRGARRGMDADASVFVEFVDYNVDHHCRAYWHKKKDLGYDDCDDYDDYGYDDCDCGDDDWDDDCDDYHHNHPPKKHNCKPGCDHDDHHHCKPGCDHDDHHHCKPGCDHDDHHHCKPHKRPRRCTRRFDVSVVLRVTVKVMSDREVMLHQGPQYGLPIKPKG
ncbi:MAG: SPOCS domain-containing protein [Sporomusa sp.]